MNFSTSMREEMRQGGGDTHITNIYIHKPQMTASTVETQPAQKQSPLVDDRQEKGDLLPSERSSLAVNKTEEQKHRSASSQLTIERKGSDS